MAVAYGTVFLACLLKIQHLSAILTRDYDFQFLTHPIVIILTNVISATCAASSEYTPPDDPTNTTSASTSTALSEPAIKANV
jgi:hypothetical protein